MVVNDEKCDMLNDLDALLDASRFYFYDDTYHKHIKNIKKLRKHIKADNEEKYISESEVCDG